MECKFYKNTAQNNVIDKSKFITEKLTKTINLKDNTSIVYPSLLVSGTVGDFKDVNYVYLPSTKRYYYVTNITSVRQNLLQIDCRCDVLYTWKDSILNGYGKIIRSKTKYNKYLQDTVSVKNQQNSLCQTRQFPNGFNNESYILCVCGTEGGE